ncbi:MAG: TIGR04282 family arsenosugar biosynthesis glycosyltransferase, partial [Ginsengibacter sp.]
MSKALMIFIKNKIEGKVKTRLAATIGHDTAMNIYQQLIEHTNTVTNRIEADKIIFYSNFIEDDIWENSVYKKQVQHGDTLGVRMENAFKSSFTAGHKKAIIIGTDCPEINENILKNAFEKLNDFDIVIGPATDGGYYLLGMKKENPFLFKNFEWSTDKVLQHTI